MWQRRTFHECAEELGAISQDFRAAYTNRFGWAPATRNRVMRESSERGVEVLRILALSIRGDQDVGLTDTVPSTVGALRSNVPEADLAVIFTNYRPPYASLPGFQPLTLRQALNKIAHADPTTSSFYADLHTHDLILSGFDHGQRWVAVISLIDLCCVIKDLPDTEARK